jgi:hypothetical protein
MNLKLPAYFFKRYLFFCKIVKNKTIEFRKIYAPVFKQNPLWDGVFGMRFSEGFFTVSTR